MKKNEIINGDALSVLRQLPNNSVNCCVTSPPYFGLRDYGVENQVGLEQTPEEYVEKLIEIFREVKRCLKDDGTIWVNLGDSYYNYRGQSDYQSKQTISKHDGHKMNRPSGKRNIKSDNLKGKDLIGIPWMVAFALRSDGWYLRQDIIWHKPNPMPESVTDRCTKSHEYIFLLSKSQKYYFDHDAIKTPLKDSSVNRLNQDVESQEVSDRVPGKTNGKMKAVGYRPHGKEQDIYWPVPYANKKSVWTVTTKPYKEAHFATYPEMLIVDCIKAGCPEGGVVLDPFMGAGTTAIVSRKLNRNYVGIELNPEYVDIANKRIYKELGLFI